jgi:alpha-beta hydrolase superfamily lysophospholipase
MQGIDQQMSQDGFPKSVHAHSGFVVSAQASLAIVEKHLAAIENAGQPAKVILTGHSAGGAVASLLYARLTLNNSCKLFPRSVIRIVLTNTSSGS